MGVLREGPPRDFIEKISKEYDVNIFVETGTHRALTTIWASGIFDDVYTIEGFKPLYDEVSTKYKDFTNVSFIYGNSKNKLPEILFEINKPVIFWLDAHYSGEGTYGEKDKCPLVDEILAVNQYCPDSIILIDDARVFLSPYSVNFKIDDWPTISEIINLLNKITGRYILVLEDVIFCVPETMKNFTAKYAQELNSMNTLINSGGLNIMKKLLKYLIKKIRNY